MHSSTLRSSGLLLALCSAVSHGYILPKPSSSLFTRAFAPRTLAVGTGADRYFGGDDPAAVSHGYILPKPSSLSLSSSSLSSSLFTRAFAPRTLAVGTGADRYFGGDDPAAADITTTNNKNNISDLSIEAAIGQAQHASEYERDAEFYRKRNEAYSKSLRTDDLSGSAFSISSSSSVSSSVTSSVTSSSSSSTDGESESASASRRRSNASSEGSPFSPSSLKASFDHVEASTNSLLKGNPLVALAIFGATGMLVAYLSGFFFLEGYIENWNPAENDQVPYWEDAEIHTIQRVVE
eukprot:CAMPEP_0172410098 /NCGR_PEP_ID=MMETSP1061-20121228/76702_1 /TAXON_ID=37318 /ORGANISM="Pseudo-nitzschia pungens, Strain cf. pungens" /LENGTH=293 /DNA_ID=CAMNT_0013146267 /DNA_START=367 /DNA_END=1248 /DNA_ORIENTATION=+